VKAVVARWVIGLVLGWVPLRWLDEAVAHEHFRRVAGRRKRIV
jgi:hypothetical protein